MWRSVVVRSRLLLALSVAMVGTALLVAGVWAAEPWPATGMDDCPAERAIFKSLGESTRMEFIETPLEDVVAFLRDQHKIPIEIHKVALDNIGVGTDTPITRQFKDISLRSALRLILDDLSLTYVVADEVLLITTPERADAHPQVRIYNVASFVKDAITAQELAATLRQALDGDASPPAAGGYAASPAPATGGGPAAALPCASPPVEAGLSATPVSSPLRIIPFQHLLVVRHTTRGHEDVARLLGALAENLKEARK
jgi:hypothetical protein